MSEAFEKYKSSQKRVATQLGKTRNSETLASFVAYCQANPELRFWQALRNWAGVNFILISKAPWQEATSSDLEDTFYREGK